MRQSHLFGKTVRETPKDVGNKSTEYLLRGSFIAESVAGRYYMLPLGMRVQDKIMKVVEEEMNATGAQKMITPTLHPLELWKETNRTSSAGFELMKVVDRRGGEFAIGGTAEEMFVDLVRKYTMSYKDLPFTLYQFSQKFRDEMRARGGLLRVREFMMKDAYSFHANESDFRKEYESMWKAYARIFTRLGLKTLVAESDNGYIGGEYCHEFIVESEVGESKILATEDGSYSAHEDVALFVREEKNSDETEKEMQEVDAVRGNSMEDGVTLHNLPLWQQMKNVMMVDEKGNFVLAVIRGDLDVNETKLKHVVDAHDLRFATEEEIRELGSEPGFISPVGMNKKVKIIGDQSLRTIKNAYTGSNKKHRDLLNVNIDRDYTVEIEADIALAQEGHLAHSGMKLVATKGIEVGNIFQLGNHYSSRMHATFVDTEGKEVEYYMGCYGIGIGRTLATIVEKYHDEKGILWPESVAPFRVHLISLCRTEEHKAQAESLYQELLSRGIEVLFDDREEMTAGAKFADSDLIGISTRVVVSPRTLENNSVEVKKRNESDAKVVSREELFTLFA